MIFFTVLIVLIYLYYNVKEYNKNNTELAGYKVKFHFTKNEFELQNTCNYFKVKFSVHNGKILFRKESITEGLDIMPGGFKLIYSGTLIVSDYLKKDPTALDWNEYILPVNQNDSISQQLELSRFNQKIKDRIINYYNSKK